MKRTIIFAIFSAICVATVLGTPRRKSRSETPSESQQIESSALCDSTLLFGEWVLCNVHGTPIEGDERPYINIDKATGRFYGSNGCNILNGDFSLGPGNALRFSHVISSMMSCRNDRLQYLVNSTLDQVRKYAITRRGHEYYLDLCDGHGHNLMIYRKHNMGFLNGIWNVARINDEPNHNENIQIAIDTDALTVHGNTGCHIVNGRLLIDHAKGNSIQFINLVTLTNDQCKTNDINEAEHSLLTSETALLIALEETEHAYHEPDGSVRLCDRRDREVLKLTPLPQS